MVASSHANMLHLHLPVPRESVIYIHHQLVREHVIWMFNRAQHDALPDTSISELYKGDNLEGAR